LNADPRETIATAPMSRLQIIAIAITIGLNALDGFDVLSISFASPGIAKEWGIDRGALGIVLSMELIGMALGSIFLGGVADRIGRRRTILGCLVLMAAGMFMASMVTGLVELSAWRIVTGLGIGGMLAAINAAAAEFSSERHRHLSVSLMAIGYPIGAVLGGLIVRELLKGQDWRSVFHFGAIITAVFIPLVWLWVPESVYWLTRKQPAGALERINRTLQRMGHAAISVLPTIAAEVRKRSVADIFRPGLVAMTVLVTLAYFFHITTFYFIIKWVPKIVVDMGFSPSSAADVLVWTNVGGASGGAVLGLLALRYGIRPLTMIVMALSTVMVVIFGHTPADLARLSIICACSGFATNAAIVGMYAIFAQAFPTHVRASGTGFAVGVGRGGSVLSPIVAGFLFQGGLDLPTVAVMMSIGSLVAAGLLVMVKLRAGQSAAELEAAMDKTMGTAGE
jgi:benzoate transport